MSRVLSVYSGKDISISAVNAALGVNIQVAGVAENGLNQTTVRLLTDHVLMKVGADGAVVPSYIPGDNGEIEIQVWQTSILHAALLAWFNSVSSAARAGDVSNVFAGQVLIASTVAGGSSHFAEGCCPVKVPDKVYGTEAQPVSWVIRAASIQST
jgi:hypothetical protein